MTKKGLEIKNLGLALLCSAFCWLISECGGKEQRFQNKPSTRTAPATTSIRLQAVIISLRLSYIVWPLINIMQMSLAVEL